MLSYYYLSCMHQTCDMINIIMSLSYHILIHLLILSYVYPIMCTKQPLINFGNYSYIINYVHLFKIFCELLFKLPNNLLDRMWKVCSIYYIFPIPTTFHPILFKLSRFQWKIEWATYQIQSSFTFSPSSQLNLLQQQPSSQRDTNPPLFILLWKFCLLVCHVTWNN